MQSITLVSSLHRANLSRRTGEGESRIEPPATPEKEVEVMTLVAVRLLGLVKRPRHVKRLSAPFSRASQ